MKTPEEVITLAVTGGVVVGCKPSATTEIIMEALDAAGYAVVPKEPTEEMLERGAQMSGAGWAPSTCVTVSAKDFDARDIYRAMLVAAIKKAANP